MRYLAAILPILLLASPAPLSGPVRPAEPEFAGIPGSGMANIATTPEGNVVLTWLEPAGERHAFRFAVRRDGRWSAPGTIAEGRPFFVNWADFPSIVITPDNRWVVHWLERTAEKSYAYHVLLSVSTDQGRTWSAPVTAHSDRSPTEHGFVAMEAAADGTVDLAWLDGRAMNMDAGGHGRGDMTVRFGTLTRGGTMTGETVLDDRTCECCQVAMARTTAGPIVAYRDRSEGEVRDIAVVRRVEGKWTAPVRVAEDDWVYGQCPVNGPAIVADGDRVTVTWFTGVGSAPRTWAAVSGDGGARFSPRIRIDDGDPVGRVDAFPLGGGATLVVWLEGTSQTTAEWRARRIGVDGQASRSWTVAPSLKARQAGFARLARAGSDILMAYRDPSESGGVRVARVDLPTPSRR